ncbi:hypothetical protein EGK75_12195 [Neisseria weixii]|uniref:Uncharacterized protein n=1 Tax=Neisseria weixii TaxID=1853276 RepID=A0A3N4MWG4_9NEIS|nr:hypothetical protein EGK74_12285 [Neisseria weixii]RPD84214.1 hypothetical protein EGK75_12195 [Neisseria weixii]
MRAAQKVQTYHKDRQAFEQRITKKCAKSGVLQRSQPCFIYPTSFKSSATTRFLLLKACRPLRRC